MGLNFWYFDIRIVSLWPLMNSTEGLVGCIRVLRHFTSYGDIMAVGDAYVFPGFLTPVITQLFFPKPATTFLTCYCRGESENSPDRKVFSTVDPTNNHQVMSLTCSPLSHLGRALYRRDSSRVVYDIRVVLSCKTCGSV